jgi:parvulin-like peptidyl-prolyl cis-trans isomerase-like protein
MSKWLSGWLREPLLHFLVAGAALFALSSGTSNPGTRQDDRIVVSAATVDQLAQGWARLWLRPPTAEELDGLIADHVREEVMVREALAVGLDRDDTIIRRRLRQKLEFVSEDVGALAEPSERQLEEYLRGHAETFRQEPRYTFVHVFLSPSRRGAALARDAERLLDVLRQPGQAGDAAEHGDPFLLPFEFQASPSIEIGRLFGNEFATALGTLSLGVWHGPIRSGYGAHLVLVRERLPGRLPALAEVRDAVRREWITSARRQANESFYQNLRRRYSVSVERPPSATTLVGPGEQRFSAGTPRGGDRP